MTILSCLLRWLLPPLVLFAISITFFFYFYWHLGTFDTLVLIALAASIASACALIVCLTYVVKSISKPLQQLKEIALDIAAGDYRNTHLNVAGPEEIKDLADALNTMSECVQENISRMNEDSTRRERMHGEYECAMLLQQEMLQNPAEHFSHEKLNLRLITHLSATSPHGLLLKTDQKNNGDVSISIHEAAENGFNSMYQLLLDPNSSGQSIQLNFSLGCTLLEYSLQNMPQPIIWSTQREQLVLSPTTSIVLEKGDLIFLYNHGFKKRFDRPSLIHDWFHRVLRHFAVEGMDLFLTMLNCEVNFLTRRHHIDHDINILCIQLIPN